MSLAVRKQLAAELTRMRLAAGLTQQQVAKKKIAVVETIRSIEKAERPIKPSYVQLLCELYAPGDTVTRDRLLDMAATTEKGWWEPYRSTMDPHFLFFIQSESISTQVCTYDSELLYGLLQTPGYHRSVYAADPSLPAQFLDREVQFRIERQKAALARTPPLKITTVLNAAILERTFDGMDEQRQHLLSMARQSFCDLYVLPWSAGLHAAMSGSFKILSSDLPDVPDVVYLESSAGVRYTEEKDALQLYWDKFRSVRQQAVTLEEYLS